MCSSMGSRSSSANVLGRYDLLQAAEVLGRAIHSRALCVDVEQRRLKFVDGAMC